MTAVLAGLAATGLGTALGWRRATVPMVTGVLGSLAIWTLLQCVPLPVSVLAHVSPSGAEIWHRAMLAAGEAAPSWAPLSVAPELTLVEAVKWGSYAILSWVGVLWARQRGLAPICWAVAILALAIGAVTVLHGVFDATKIFGIYKPHNEFGRWTRGPLLNVNHLSAYLSLGLFASLSLLLRDGERSVRQMAVLVVMAVAMVTGVVGLASRAAVASLALGSLLVPVTLLEWGPAKKRQQRSQRKQPLLMLLGIFGLGLVLALYGFGAGVAAGLGERNLSKLVAARDSLHLVRAFWLTGVGRGGFEGAFFRYKSPGDYESWVHAENIVVQWASEWGVPVALLAAAGILWALVRASGWRTTRSGRILALGLGMSLLHELLDYHFELPALGGLGALLLGALVGAPARASMAVAPEREGPEGPRLRLPPVVLTGLVGVVSVLAFVRRPEMLTEVHRRAYEQLRIARADPSLRAQMVAPFGGWARRFPADPYLPTVAGLMLSDAEPGPALRWFGWAIERGPNLGLARLGVAEVLGRTGRRAQALLELRLALARDPFVGFQASTSALRLVRDADEVMALAPQDATLATAFLETVVAGLDRRPEILDPLRERILLTYPCAVRVRQARLNDLLARLNTRTAPCDAAGLQACKIEAEDQLKHLRDCPGTEVAVMRGRAELQWAAGDRREALALLEASCDGQDGDLGPCMTHLANRAAEVRDRELLRRAVRVSVARRCQDATACGQAWAWAAALNERVGDMAGALAAITKATEHDPSSIELRYEQARLSQAVGATGRAEQILQQVLVRHPGDAKAQQQLKELRANVAPSASSR